MLEIVCVRPETYKHIEVEERMERMRLGCEMLNARKSLKLMYKMGECGAGVEQSKLVLDKAKDVEQMWQKAGIV